MTEKEKEKLRKQYSEQLTLENVRRILHISKRKASWLFKNGYIKCTNSGKKTRQFSVNINDLFVYIDSAESMHLPSGIFSSRTTVASSFGFSYTDFVEWLQNIWSSVHDVITLDEVAVITGYTLASVQKWTNIKNLQSVWIQKKRITTKEWLIEFFATKAGKIVRKSVVHLQLLKKFYNAH